MKPLLRAVATMAVPVALALLLPGCGDRASGDPALPWPPDAVAPLVGFGVVALMISVALWADERRAR